MIHDRDPGDESDFKPGSRVRDPELLKLLHHVYEECVLCGRIEFSIHHILKRSQGGDDVSANLIPLCGHGTAGCHGRVEASEEEACRALGVHISRYRHDTITYLAHKLGGPEAAHEWLRRRLRLSS